MSIPSLCLLVGHAWHLGGMGRCSPVASEDPMALCTQAQEGTSAMLWL